LTDVTVEDLIDAAQHLAKSAKGRDALRAILKWLDDSGIGLDHENKKAVFTLMFGAFGKFPGTARDAMRDALDP